MADATMASPNFPLICGETSDKRRWLVSAIVGINLKTNETLNVMKRFTNLFLLQIVMEIPRQFCPLSFRPKSPSNNHVDRQPL